jgi:hypothetical protein
VKAGHVHGERVHLAVDVDTALAQPVRIDISSPAGHAIAEAPLGVHEAAKLRDTLAEAVELACNPRYRAEAS